MVGSEFQESRVPGNSESQQEMKPTLKYIRYNPILCNILIGLNDPEILEEIIVSSSYNNNKN